MRFRSLVAVAAAGVGAACQQEQSLPFSVDQTATVEKTIGNAGGTVSTPAGAALVFPSGAVNASTPVTVAPAAPTTRIAAIGAPVATTSITITPAGQTLRAPAQFETRISPSAAQREDAWLSVVLLETPDGVRVFPNVGIDLSNGILRADIDQLGTLTAIVPPEGAHFPVKAGTPPALASSLRLGMASAEPAAVAVPGVKTLGMSCGFIGVVPADRIVYCTGMEGYASQNLLDHYGTVEVIWPEVAGTLAMGGDPTVAGGATVTGTIASNTTFRAQGGNGSSAVSVPFKVTLSGTPQTRATQVGDKLTLTNVWVTRDWTDATEAGYETLTLTVSSGVATLSQSRGIDLGNGTIGTAWVRFAFDVTSW